jgi:hypothetical protein
MKKPKSSALAIDPFKLFKQATFFELASFRLSRAFKAGDEAMRVPFIVNSAFSFELFLKCLLAIEGKCDFRNIHDLHKLHGMLNDKHAKRIGELFDQNMASNPVMRNIYKAEKAGIIPTLAWGIIEILERIKDAFRAWRYSYELPKN